MKAIVMEIRGARAVLMTEGGSFEIVKNENYRVGQRVSWAEKRCHPVRRLLLVASILLIFMTGIGTLAVRLPFTYVSLDINPSIEYSLNWFDRVISVRAVNDDAQPIVRKLLEQGVENQPVDRAIDMTLAKLQESDYVVSGSENDVILAVASFGIKNVDGLTKQLSESADEYGCQNSFTITTLQADSASVNRSREFKTTAGKLILVESLGALEGNPSSFSKEEWLNKPVREILNFKEALHQQSADEADVGAPSAAPSTTPGDPDSKSRGKVGPSGRRTPFASVSPKNSPTPKSSTPKPKNTQSHADTPPKKKTPSPSTPKNEKNGSSKQSSRD